MRRYLVLYAILFTNCTRNFISTFISTITQNKFHQWTKFKIHTSQLKFFQLTNRNFHRWRRRKNNVISSFNLSISLNEKLFRFHFPILFTNCTKKNHIVHQLCIHRNKFRQKFDRHPTLAVLAPRWIRGGGVIAIVSFRSICQGRAGVQFVPGTSSWESSVVRFAQRSLFTVNYLSNRAEIAAAAREATGLHPR